MIRGGLDAGAEKGRWEGDTAAWHESGPAAQDTIADVCTVCFLTPRSSKLVHLFLTTTPRLP
jgi:hypothetical protein